jgi:hypothetical protein
MTTFDLIDALLSAVPTDMEREDDFDIRRPCYSVSALASHFGNTSASEIARAFEGVPIFRNELRIYLRGHFARRGL